MFCCDLLVPALMILCGWMMWKHCPKNRNWLMGYRTSRSMKNRDTWKFAHEYCGKLWWKIGWILLVPSILAHLPLYGANDDTIGMAGTILMTIQVVLLIASLFPTERALKRTFTNEGLRR